MGQEKSSGHMGREEHSGSSIGLALVTVYLGNWFSLSETLLTSRKYASFFPCAGPSEDRSHKMVPKQKLSIFAHFTWRVMDGREE